MSLRPILCVAGASGSGKTRLLERLIPRLSAEGLKVGVVKHAGHGPAADLPEKDSARLAAAGAWATVAAGPQGLIVRRDQSRACLLDLAQMFCPGCDLVLAEGYKRSPHEKILLAGAGDEADDGISSVRLVVSDAAGRPAGAMHRDDVEGLAKWVVRWLARRRGLGAGVIGAILAGGQSRRMGSDKAALRLGGVSVLARLAELLGGRLEEVWVIGRASGESPETQGADLPRCLRWHLDLRPGRGPLGGIATALRVAGEPGPRAVLAVACDMPALAGEAVDLLLQHRRRDGCASALRNPRTGTLEPLAAVYEPAALPVIERTLQTADFSATRLLEAAGAHVIEVPPDLAGQLINVNTPEQLDAIENGT